MKCGFINSVALCALVLGSAFLLRAQDLRVRVVNGKNGRPVSEECLNVAIGGWHGANLIAPTDRSGVLVLHLKDGEISADSVAPRACNDMAFTGPVVIPKGTELLAFLPNWQISCEWHTANVPGAPVVFDRLAPSYSIQMILDSGVTTNNTCGKVRMKANPGELVLFVRPPTFWEAMRR
jgi:hypothetical protein